ncbi:hypothetical protein PHET_03316 [Paragonimus heterotremus]|uniref:Uncharacterized protein n=1 Tax=Paragonimus heterotremus TaxID=100268 RepID=A0A8J4TK62_9TREM|nr:hypothetical protein PHET_03316 [Paragonimus heterotremus]
MDSYWVPLSSKPGNAISYSRFSIGKRVVSCPLPGRAFVLTNRPFEHESCSADGKSTELPVLAIASDQQSLVCFVNHDLELFSSCIVGITVNSQLDVDDTSEQQGKFPDEGFLFCETRDAPTFVSLVNNQKDQAGDGNSSEKSVLLQFIGHVYSPLFLQDAYQVHIYDNLFESDQSSAYYTPPNSRTSSSLFSLAFSIDENLYVREPQHASEFYFPPNQSAVIRLSHSLTIFPVCSSSSLYYSAVWTLISHGVEEWHSLPPYEKPVEEYESLVKWSCLQYTVQCTRPVYFFHNFGRQQKLTPKLSEECLSFSDELLSGQHVINTNLRLNSLLQEADTHLDKVNWTDFPAYNGIQRLSKLFQQNSAADNGLNDTQNLPTTPVKTPASGLTSSSSPAATSTLDASVNDTCSRDSSSVLEGLKDEQLGKQSLLISQQSASKSSGRARPSLVSVCGVDVESDELKTLNDVPLEFTAAEIYLRRTIKAESGHYDQRASILANRTLSKQKSSVDVTNFKRSSILVKTPDDSNTQSKRHGVDSGPSNPRVHRTSLCVLHPPQRPLFTREPDTQEDQLFEPQDVGSWATIDSTELSRGLNLMGLRLGTSSSEVFEAFGSYRDHRVETRDQAVQVHELELSWQPQFLFNSYEPPPSQSTTCTITPSLHHCTMRYQQHLQSLEPGHSCCRTASPDATKFIVRMKQMAFERIRAKGDRFPSTTWTSMYG